MPQSKASLYLQDNNFKFQHHHHGATIANNNDKQPRQPLGQAFDLSSLGADLPPNTGPPGTVPVTNGSSSNANKNLSHVPCKFFKQGNCQAGDSCPFSHNVEGALAADRLPCKYFLRGNCKFGLKCALAHYLPDGTRVNAKNILGTNGNNNGNGYSNQSYGAKQQRYSHGQTTNYNINQGNASSQTKASPEYSYGRMENPEEEFTARARYTSASPPDAHPAGAATLSSTGYYNNYHVNQHSQSQQQSQPSKQPAFPQFGQQNVYPQQQQQQYQQPQQHYTQSRHVTPQEAPISLNTLTDDSLTRFLRQLQQEQQTPRKQESLSWSPVEQYTKPADYQYPQWGVQHRRVSSHNQPHSLGNTYSNAFSDVSTFNVPTTQLQNTIRRSYSTGGQFPTLRTAISPPQSCATSGINIQSSTPSANTPTSRFSFSSGASTAFSQVNDYSLPIKPNNLQCLYQNISLASPVFDDEEDEGRESNGFDYNSSKPQGNSDAVFEEDFLPGSLADVILTPQELKRRDSRSQSGTLNNRQSLRGLLEEIGYTEVDEEDDFDVKPRATPHEDVFLME